MTANSSIIQGLTLPEKVALLSGTPNDFASIAGIPEKGIPTLKTADSTSGIRPSDLSSTLSTASFPNTACVASTWNSGLLKRMGRELTRQAKSKHAQMILGPAINMHRDPRCGRNFEYFSEDPLLTGYLGAALVNGIQNEGFGACAKHFVYNDSETMRRHYNVKESPYGRTLREIYLAAWYYLFKRSTPMGVMTAYNKVDGLFCCDSEVLIKDVLRGEMGFQGLVMSDWFGTRSTAAAAKAGVDLEMPMPVMRGDKLVQAVKNGEVDEKTIDESVERLLNLRALTKSAQSEGPETSEISEETNALALEIAQEGIVLLKNERDALPLKVTDALRVAVVGEFATAPVATGGGSASCKPQYQQNPLELLRKEFAVPENVSYTPGVRTRRLIPAISSDIITTKGEQGVEISYFNEGAEDPALTETSKEAILNLMGRGKPGVTLPGSRVEMSTTVSPKTTGSHTIALRHTGDFSLKVDGVEILTGKAPDVTTEQAIFNLTKLESRIDFPMEAGKQYNVQIAMQSRPPVIGEPTPYALTLAFEEEYSEDQAIQEAVQAAEAADICLIYAGRSEQYESEGFDLEQITLPPAQVKFIKAVAAASKKSALLLHCGNPIDIDEFAADVDAIVQMHFPGQEGPRAMSTILTGKCNPSGKLATTWFKTLEDYPSCNHFPAKDNGTGEFEITYDEGVAVGYRAPVAVDRIQFPFGHGLSYTSFSYDNLKVSLDDQSKPSVLNVEVSVTNTGAVAGKEVAQVYISPPADLADWRPARELKEFAKIDLQPGESQQVKFAVDMVDVWRHWSDSSRGWVVDRGVYGVEVGGKKASFEV